MIQKFEGELEIDSSRGVIYFHDTKTGRTLLRICSLPKPVPEIDDKTSIDITYGHGVSYTKE